MPDFNPANDKPPTPSAGFTTYTSAAAMIVGVIVAVLSLFDVIPTDEDVQALGVIVGAVLFAVPYVVSAISRTKQANNLANLAAAERRLVTSKALTPATLTGTSQRTAYFAPATEQPVSGFSPELQARAAARWDAAEAEERGDAETMLGAPEDLSREVPGGGARPEDLADARRAAIGGDGDTSAVGASSAEGLTPAQRVAHGAGRRQTDRVGESTRRDVVWPEEARGADR